MTYGFPKKPQRRITRSQNLSRLNKTEPFMTFQERKKWLYTQHELAAFMLAIATITRRGMHRKQWLRRVASARLRDGLMHRAIPMRINGKTRYLTANYIHNILLRR